MTCCQSFLLGMVIRSTDGAGRFRDDDEMMNSNTNKDHQDNLDQDGSFWYPQHDWQSRYMKFFQ